MKKYSIIHVPVLSFFSKALYRDVAVHWKTGLCFAYLLLLLAICLIPTAIETNAIFSGLIENQAPAIVKQVPEITITDGKASIAEPQPYYIKAPDSDDNLAVIDTTGSITSLEDADAFCLLTGTELIMRKSQVQTQTFDLKEIENFVLNSELIMGWLRTIKKIFAIGIYPFLLLVSYPWTIILALIFAAIGLFFAYLCKTKLSYDALLRLTIVAITPYIIIKTILGAVGAPLPCLLNLAVALGYLFFAVYAASEALPEQVEEAKEVKEVKFIQGPDGNWFSEDEH